MTKSPLVVGAIGIAGCLALSLTMREALETQQQRRRNPLELALESRFGEMLSSPVRVVNRREAGRERVFVELHLRPEVEPDGITATAGQLVWDCRRAAGEEPDEVMIAVTSNENRDLRWLSVPRPRSWR